LIAKSTARTYTEVLRVLGVLGVLGVLEVLEVSEAPVVSAEMTVLEVLK
jgi:hypothetical protein